MLVGCKFNYDVCNLVTFFFFISELVSTVAKLFYFRANILHSSMFLTPIISVQVSTLSQETYL